MTKPNAIAVCCTASWLPYAAATLLSCFRQGAAAQADFHVFVSDATAQSAQQWSTFCEAQGFSATLHAVNASAELQGLQTLRFSAAALLRLLLDKLLPPHYQRVLYLDCDILAQSPMADLFSFNLGGKALGAVEDYESLPGPLRLLSDHPRKIGLAADAPYFNSGVLLFDWPQTLAGKFLPKTLRRIHAMQAEGQALRLPDQDALNIEFAGAWARLPLRYNMMAFFADYFREKPVLRHYSNRLKPWGNTWQPGFAEARVFYHQALSGSPWPAAAPVPYRRISIIETAGTTFRKLDPVSGRRYAKHLGRP